MLEQAQRYLNLFEQYRGFKPREGNIDVDAQGTTTLRIPGFAEVKLHRGDKGKWEMPTVKTYAEGPRSVPGYKTPAGLGWPTERGMPSKIACIFADWYAKKRERGEKPPYFLCSPAEYLEKYPKKRWT